MSLLELLLFSEAESSLIFLRFEEDDDEDDDFSSFPLMSCEMILSSSSLLMKSNSFFAYFLREIEPFGRFSMFIEEVYMTENNSVSFC